MDMEQKDYDSRTALHVAAAEGIFLVLDFLFVFHGRVSLCGPGCPGTCSID
jgi:hypothetical protein